MKKEKLFTLFVIALMLVMSFAGSATAQSINERFGNILVEGTAAFVEAVSFESAATIDGTADEVQLTVQGHSTQTNNVLEVENSAGTAKAVIDNDGKAIFAGGMELSGGPLIMDRQDEVVTATFIITPTSSNIVLTSGAAYTSDTTTPVITTTATDGQMIFIRNGNASDALTIDGTGGTVECKANVALGAGDIMTLMYDGTNLVWYCQSVYDNS